MRQVYRAGEKVFIDYSGKKPQTCSPETGEVIDAELFVAVMSAERMAAEGLRALQRNRATHVAAQINRVMARLMPRSIATTVMGAMIGKRFAARARVAETRGPGD